jgi:response regulator NasT
MIESVLIISYSEKSSEDLTVLLNAVSVHQIENVKTCKEARRLLIERDFDLVIINTPFPDETGEELSRQIAAKNISQVILIVKSEYFEAVCKACENDGVLTVAKPLNKKIFWSALSLAKAAQSRLRRAASENAGLKAKIEDIKIIDRAKCILISYMNMNEKEAHRYIEKQAMNERVTKRIIAERILKTYEN